MSNRTQSPCHVEATYALIHGLVIREDGKTRPGTLDEVEQCFGQAKLDAVMESGGRWVTLAAPSFRCWRSSSGVAFVVVPGTGKIQLGMESAAANPALKSIYNRIADADRDAWRWQGTTPPTGKAFVSLSSDEIALIAGRCLPRVPARPTVTRTIAVG